MRIRVAHGAMDEYTGKLDTTDNECGGHIDSSETIVGTADGSPTCYCNTPGPMAHSPPIGSRPPSRLPRNHFISFSGFIKLPMNFSKATASLPQVETRVRVRGTSVR